MRIEHIPVGANPPESLNVVDLEPEKWVRVGEWGDAVEARRITLEPIERAKAAKG